jgi:hypothetical protein
MIPFTFVTDSFASSQKTGTNKATARKHDFVALPIEHTAIVNAIAPELTTLMT